MVDCTLFSRLPETTNRGALGFEGKPMWEGFLFARTAMVFARTMYIEGKDLSKWDEIPDTLYGL